ncbi:MAG: hypothetical protein AAFY67_01295 [Cyanobacteria bacterium J06642_9]
MTLSLRRGSRQSQLSLTLGSTQIERSANSFLEVFWVNTVSWTLHRFSLASIASSFGSRCARDAGRQRLLSPQV